MTSIINNFNQFIEHTNLKPSVTSKDIILLCNEAIQYSFFGVVVNPFFVKEAVKLLKNEKIKVISVCDFPLGVNKTKKKIAEAVKLVESGVDEIDMVANIKSITDYDYEFLAYEVRLIREEIPKNIILKVIIEVGLLTDEQIINSVKVVIDSKADFVKTSTGTSKNVTLEQFKLVAVTSENKIKLKASGGIRTLSDSWSFIEAGAHRIGTSSSVRIINEYLAQKS